MINITNFTKKIINYTLITILLCPHFAIADNNNFFADKLAPKSRWAAYGGSLNQGLNNKEIDALTLAIHTLEELLRGKRSYDSSFLGTFNYNIDYLNGYFAEIGCNLKITASKYFMMSLSLPTKDKREATFPYIILSFGGEDGAAKQRIILFNIEPEQLTEKAQKAIGFDVDKDSAWFKTSDNDKVWIVGRGITLGDIESSLKSLPTRYDLQILLNRRELSYQLLMLKGLVYRVVKNTRSIGDLFYDRHQLVLGLNPTRHRRDKVGSDTGSSCPFVSASIAPNYSSDNSRQDKITYLGTADDMVFYFNEEGLERPNGAEIKKYLRDAKDRRELSYTSIAFMDRDEIVFKGIVPWEKCEWILMSEDSYAKYREGFVKAGDINKKMFSNGNKTFDEIAVRIDRVGRKVTFFIEGREVTIQIPKLHSDLPWPIAVMIAENAFVRHLIENELKNDLQTIVNETIERQIEEKGEFSIEDIISFVKQKYIDRKNTFSDGLINKFSATFVKDAGRYAFDILAKILVESREYTISRTVLDISLRDIGRMYGLGSMIRPEGEGRTVFVKRLQTGEEPLSLDVFYSAYYLIESEAPAFAESTGQMRREDARRTGGKNGEGTKAGSEVKIDLKGVDFENLGREYGHEVVEVIKKLIGLKEYRVEVGIESGNVNVQCLGEGLSTEEKRLVSDLISRAITDLFHRHNFLPTKTEAVFMLNLSSSIDELGRICFLPHISQDELELHPIALLNNTLLMYALRHEIDHAWDEVNVDEYASERMAVENDRKFFTSLSKAEKGELLWLFSNDNPNGIDVTNVDNRILEAVWELTEKEQLIRTRISVQIHRMLLGYLRLISSREYGKVEKIKTDKFVMGEEITLQELIEQLEADIGLIIRREDLDRMALLSKEQASSSRSDFHERSIVRTITKDMEMRDLERLRDDIRSRIEQEKMHQIKQKYMSRVAEILGNERRDREIGDLNIWSNYTSVECKEIKQATIKDLIESIKKGLDLPDGLFFLGRPIDEVIKAHHSPYMEFQPYYDPLNRREKGWETLSEAEATLRQVEEYARQRAEEKSTWKMIEEENRWYLEDVPEIMRELRRKVYVPRISGGSQRDFEDTIRAVYDKYDAGLSKMGEGKYSEALLLILDAHSTLSNRTGGIMDLTGTFEKIKRQINKAERLAKVLLRMERDEKHPGLLTAAGEIQERLAELIDLLKDRQINPIKEFAAEIKEANGHDSRFVINAENLFTRLKDKKRGILKLSSSIKHILAGRICLEYLTDDDFFSGKYSVAQFNEQRDGIVAAIAKERSSIEAEPVLRREKTQAEILKEYRFLIMEYLRLISEVRAYARVLNVKKNKDGKMEIPVKELIEILEHGDSLVIDNECLRKMITVDRDRVDERGSPMLRDGWCFFEGEPIYTRIPEHWDKDRIEEAKRELEEMIIQEKIHQIRQKYMAKVLEVLTRENPDKGIGKLSISYGYNFADNRNIEGATVRDLIAGIKKGLECTDGVLFLNQKIADVLLGKDYVSLKFMPSYEHYGRSGENWLTIEEAEEDLRAIEEYANRQNAQAADKTARISELTNIDRIRRECDRIREEKFKKKVAKAYDIQEYILRWKTMSIDEKRAAWCIVRNDETLLKDESMPPELKESDYTVLFYNLANEGLMESLLHRIESYEIEGPYRKILERFRKDLSKYKGQMIKEMNLDDLSNMFSCFNEADKSIFFGILNTCENVRDQVLLSLLNAVINNKSGDPRYNKCMDFISAIISEYFIFRECNEKDSFIDILMEKPSQYAELICLAWLFFKGSEDDLVNVFNMAWYYGDTIKKCRLKNVKLVNIDVPSLDMGREVLGRVMHAVERFPDKLLWKIERPIPVRIKYEREEKTGRGSVYGGTSPNGAKRGEVTLTVTGEVMFSGTSNVTMHEFIHSLSFSKDRRGNWVLPLEDWKEIACVAGFYGYYDQYTGRIVTIDNFRSVEDLLNVPYACWIYREGDKLVNYIRLKDSMGLIFAPGVQEKMKFLGIEFRSYDSTKDIIKYAKSDLTECVALCLSEAFLSDCTDINSKGIKEVLKRNCLKSEFPNANNRFEFTSWLPSEGGYWSSYITVNVFEEIKVRQKEIADRFVGTVKKSPSAGEKRTILALDTDIGNMMNGPAKELVRTLELCDRGNVIFVDNAGNKLEDVIRDKIKDLRKEGIKTKDINVVVVTNKEKDIFKKSYKVVRVNDSGAKDDKGYIPILELLNFALAINTDTCDEKELKRLYKQITRDLLDDRTIAEIRNGKFAIPLPEPVKIPADFYNESIEILGSA